MNLKTLTRIAKDFGNSYLAAAVASNDERTPLDVWKDFERLDGSRAIDVVSFGLTVAESERLRDIYQIVDYGELLYDFDDLGVRPSAVADNAEQWSHVYRKDYDDGEKIFVVLDGALAVWGWGYDLQSAVDMANKEASE